MKGALFTWQTYFTINASMALTYLMCRFLCALPFIQNRFSAKRQLQFIRY